VIVSVGGWKRWSAKRPPAAALCGVQTSVDRGTIFGLQTGGNFETMRKSGSRPRKGGLIGRFGWRR